mgnify:CR=1 FL=1
MANGPRSGSSGSAGKGGKGRPGASSGGYSKGSGRPTSGRPTSGGRPSGAGAGGGYPRSGGQGGGGYAPRDDRGYADRPQGGRHRGVERLQRTPRTMQEVATPGMQLPSRRDARHTSDEGPVIGTTHAREALEVRRHAAGAAERRERPTVECVEEDEDCPHGFQPPSKVTREGLYALTKAVSV